MSVEDQLQRILASPEFADSQRMCRFLRFVVERSLAGEARNLKEYLIGVEVFDRKPSYDPRVDPIVRVEARRLRSKLGAYYKGEGAADPIRIELPTGTYAPVFQEAEAVAPPRTEAHHAPAPLRTIAVLPFSNLSGEGEYFSDGLTEEITHVLTKVPGLQVVAWSSAAQLKGRQADWNAAAEQLSADIILRGGVRSSAGRIRVTAQLIEARRGVVLWSEAYDRKVEDIFDVHDEIASAIADALQLNLIETRARTATSCDLTSYNLYLEGRYHWNQRSPEGLLHSADCFRQAIDMDCQYALAHAGLADAYTILVDYGLLQAEDLEKAECAARKAIEMDPNLAEPYATMGLISSFLWRWNEAEDWYRKSVSLNFNYSTAHHWLGIDYYAHQGRFEEAERELAIARRLDPLSAITFESSGMLYMLWGRSSDALALYQTVLRRDPSSHRIPAAMGRLCIHQGDYRRAIELLEMALALKPDTVNMMGALGQAFALAGRRSDACHMLDRLHYLAERMPLPGTALAMVNIGLGQYAQAIDWLERSAEWHDPRMLSIGVHPAYKPLRSEPRFRALVERMGLIGAEQRAESYRKIAQ